MQFYIGKLIDLDIPLEETGAEFLAAFHKATDKVLRALLDALRANLSLINGLEPDTPLLSEVVEKEIEVIERETEPLSRVVGGKEKLDEEDAGLLDRLMEARKSPKFPGPRYLLGGYELTSEDITKICGVYDPSLGIERWDELVPILFGDDWEKADNECLSLARGMWGQERSQCLNCNEYFFYSEFSFVKFMFELALKWQALTPKNAKWYLGRSKASDFTKAAIAEYYGVPI